MKPLYLFIPALFLLASCEDVVDLDLPEGKPHLVVEGRVTDSAGAYVILSTTAAYFSQTETPRVTGAQIELVENGLAVGTFLESDTAPGSYYLDYTGVVNSTYHIEITVPEGAPTFGGTVWESEPEVLNRGVPFDSLYAKYLEEAPAQLAGYYVFIHLSDPAGAGDRYRLRVWRNDTLQDAPGNITVFEDRFWDGESFGTDPGNLPPVQLDRRPYEVGTTFRMELGSITPDYMNYLQLLQEQTNNGGGLFSPPPAPLWGNLHRKGEPQSTALGFFHATSVRYAETVVEE